MRMTARRIALPILALLVTAVAPGNRTRSMAPLLPEVHKHLETAEKMLAKGSINEALAHCDVVLVGGELKVAIAYELVPEAQKGQYSKSVDQAMGAWEKALEGRVRFRLVERDQDPQVVVVFKPSVLLRTEPVAGLLNWKRTITDAGSEQVRGRFTSEMLVRTLMPDGKQMPMNAIRHTVTHEMGHVFGLEDTDRVGELMGPLNIGHPLHGPEPHEVAAVVAVRQQAQQIRSEAERLLLK